VQIDSLTVEGNPQSSNASCGLAEGITLAGIVTAVNPAQKIFNIRCRSGDEFQILVKQQTNYQVLTNVDNVNRDRTPASKTSAEDVDHVARQLERYVQDGALIFIRCVYQRTVEQTDGKACIEAQTVYLLKSSPDGPFVFEEAGWWLTQTTQLADRWLDNIFAAEWNYSVGDWAKCYSTNLGIEGQQTDDSIQECATLSRLIYGLSSAYLLTGAERYFLAARAAVSFQRQAFRILTSDGRYCFWAHGRRKTKGGEEVLVASTASDDSGAIPLYEQIYALAGLSQYYRITADWEVFEDIRHTVDAFDRYFLDERAAKGQEVPGWVTGQGGYFSHIDPISFRPDSDALGDNMLKKNWNSIGDHIPAYLINVMLALDIPAEGNPNRNYEGLLSRYKPMIKKLIDLIVKKFPEDGNPYVRERFTSAWQPDTTYKWQQDCAIVGHNLKIAWNLTRCAYHLERRADWLLSEGTTEDNERSRELDELAAQCREMAIRLGRDMAQRGVDPLRGGVFDAVERNPKNGMPVEFVWFPTKDFWQQEQGILAYLILYGSTGDEAFRYMARECMAFWNLFFLDRERQGIYFRTTEGGWPIIEGIYGQKGGHSISGYHVFELNFLAHIYIRTYLERDPDKRFFCLYFRVTNNDGQNTINVLPDFMPHQRVSIHRVRINGIEQDQLDRTKRKNFQVQIPVDHRPRDDGSIEVVVEFKIDGDTWERPGAGQR
jgi:mannose/cellobiose epimerase-like protein (N-acyl-D-glucosamine 2-epimerase family)